MHYMNVPSSSCLKIIVLGISIIGVILPNIEEILVDDLVTEGKLNDGFVLNSSCLGICASITK